MIEERFTFSASENKTIERIISDDNVDINHMILNKNEALPEHYANSNAYMIVVRGMISLRFDDQPKHEYPAGSIIVVPFKTKMNVSNAHDDQLEFFVVKSPSPKTMG